MPRVGPFDDPTAGAVSSATASLFLPTAPNVRTDPSRFELVANVRVVVPFIKAEVVGATRSTRRVDAYVVEYFPDHPFVVHVRASDLDRKWNTTCVGQYVTFHPYFSAVGRVLAC